MHDTPVIVAAAYLQNTLNGTLACSSLSASGTASYETYVTGQKEFGCVLVMLRASY